MARPRSPCDGSAAASGGKYLARRGGAIPRRGVECPSTVLAPVRRLSIFSGLDVSRVGAVREPPEKARRIRTAAWGASRGAPTSGENRQSLRGGGEHFRVRTEMFTPEVMARLPTSGCAGTHQAARPSGRDAVKRRGGANGANAVTVPGVADKRSQRSARRPCRAPITAAS